MKYWLYKSISDILDWTCATIPVGHVDLLKDPKPSNGGDFKPLSSLDRDNWNLCKCSLRDDPSETPEATPFLTRVPLC